MDNFKTNIAWTLLGLPLGLSSLLYSLLCGKKQVILQDKVVLLTGASGGLGQACAESFYESGCKLILSGRNAKALEELRENLTRKLTINRHTPAIIVMDLEDTFRIPGKISDALAVFGYIDILINNAGMSCRGWAHETRMEVDKRLLDINYLGQVMVTKALLPHLMERRSGQICIISSIQGKLGIPDRAAYSASKHAVEGFFDSLRAELSIYNIDVSVVTSYYIRTNFSINAICGDGTSYQKMDTNTERGYDPRFVAEQIKQCVVNRKEEHVIAPFFVHLAICLRFMAPWLFFKIMANRARKEIATRSKNQ